MSTPFRSALIGFVFVLLLTSACAPQPGSLTLQISGFKAKPGGWDMVVSDHGLIAAAEITTTKGEVIHVGGQSTSFSGVAIAHFHLPSNDPIASIKGEVSGIKNSTTKWYWLNSSTIQVDVYEAP